MRQSDLQCVAFNTWVFVDEKIDFTQLNGERGIRMCKEKSFVG